MTISGGALWMFIGALGASLVSRVILPESGSPSAAVHLAVPSPSSEGVKATDEPGVHAPKAADAAPEFTTPKRSTPAPLPDFEPAPAPPKAALGEEASASSWTSTAAITAASLVVAGAGGWAVSSSRAAPVPQAEELCPSYSASRGRSPQKRASPAFLKGSVGDKTILEALAAAEYRR